MNGFRLERNRQVIAGAFLLAMAVGHVVWATSIWPALRRGYQDFTIFYTAGGMVGSGQVASLYDLSAQYDAQRKFAPDVRIRQAALPYNHPPFEALLFMPFACLGYVPAYLAWTALNFVMLAASLMLLRSFPAIRALSPWLLALAGAGFFPVAISFIQGQDTVLLLLIVVTALVALARQRNVIGGAVLALGLFKPHFAGPLALLLAMRRPRLLGGFIPAGLLLAGISVAMVGWRGAMNYVHFVLHLENSGAGGAIGANDMPNLRGLIDTMASSVTGTGTSRFLTIAASIALFLFTLRKERKNDHSIVATFGLGTVVTMLVSYHGLPYDLILLLPIALLLFAGQVEAANRMDTALLVVLFLTPLYAFLWLRLNQFAWFALVVIGLLCRLWYLPVPVDADLDSRVASRSSQIP
ncbi:MAG TPA: glycosyltransferase family 87 protein [Terriglobales bacterium]|nr:glycosyltransferase family 87 protein [Terriglobales bacterium]